MTIEERANRFSHKIFAQSLIMDSRDEQEIYRHDIAKAYIHGAKTAWKYLTRWHAPNEPPTHENEVLVKYICGTGGCKFYIVAYYSNGEWQAPNNTLDEYDTILGWREINE